MKPKSALRSFLALAGSSILAISPAQALPYYWDGTSATWNLPTNWSTEAAGTTDATLPTTVSDDLTFNITGANTAQNITLDVNQAAKSLTFSTTGATNFRANSSGTTARTLTLGGNITLNSGAGPVIIGQSPATYGAVNIALSAGSTWTNSSASLLSVIGDVNLGTQTLGFGGNGNVSISGKISGSNTITVSGNARRNFSNDNNDFTGQILVRGSSGTATLAFTSIANFGTASALGKGTDGTSIVLGHITSNFGILEYIGSGNSTSNRTVQVGTTSNVAGGSILNNGSGTLTFTAPNFNTTITGITHTRNLTLGGRNSGNNEIRGIIQNTDGVTGIINLTKADIGTWVLGGANTYTGSTTLDAGTLKLNYNTGAFGTNTSKLSDTATTGTLLLNGGTLELSGGSHVETVLSTTLNTGGTFIKQTGGTSTLSMGAITFTGGAINFSAGSIATTTNTVTNGILSQLATVAGANFAMKGVSDTIVAYDYVTSGVTGYTGGAISASTNYAMQTAGGANTLGSSTGATTSTLKIANTATGSLAVAANTLTLNTILFAGSADYDITTSGSGNITRNHTTTPLILHNYGTGGAVLKLGALNSNLSQFGTGKTILTQNSLADRAVNVLGGTIQFSNNLQIGTNVTARTITLNNGTLLADTTGGNIALDSSGTFSRTITLGAGGGTLDVIGGNKLTVSGVISGTGNPLTIGSASSNGKVILSATNTYSGATTVSAGTLYVTGALSSSAVTVQADGTIGSNGTAGTLGQGLTILAGGNLDLTGATLGLNSTNILSITGGTLALGNLNFLDIVGWDWANAATGTYELIDGSFTINWGSTAHLSAGTAYNFGNGKGGYFTEGSLKAVIVAIPEPRAALLGGIGMLLLLRRRRN